MKPLSRRTDTLRQSDIRAITRLVNAVDGINLGQGICDLPTPEPIREGAKKAIDDNHSIYTNYLGIRRLRERLLDKVQTYNRIPATTPDEIMVGVGSTGAFVTAMFALLDPGDEVILFEPFYGYHRNLLRMAGIDVRYVTTEAPDWHIDFDALEQAIGPNTKAIVVTTPNNPTGKVWTRAELTRLLRLLEEHDLWAITDEIYEYMLYDGHVHCSLASLPGAYERTITLSGFSKTYNMTGWRLGYAIGPNDLIEKMGLLNDLIYICAPSPLQYGAAEGLEMEDAYFDHLRADYAARRTLMCETLERIGFDVPWPQGAYYVLASFEPLAGKRPGFEDAQTAGETLVHKAGVATVPGPSFFKTPERGKYHLRFCFAKEIPVLEQACRQLIEAFGEVSVPTPS